MAEPWSLSRFFKQFFYSQLFVQIPAPKGDFSGQTVIVTGSNTGLGFEAARHLLRLNASKVILAVRDVTKGESAAERLLSSTGATKNAIEVWPLDLSSHGSVKRFSEMVNGLNRLDAVISNAAILTKQWEVVEGLERQIAVNVVNTTLLGLLLLPKLRASAKKYQTRGRVAFVTSEAQYVARVTEANVEGSLFDALSDKKVALMEDRYATSKLLLIYAIREIAGRSPVTPESNVILNTVTPGFCRSSLFRDRKTWLHSFIVGALTLIIGRSTSTGGGLLVQAVRSDLPVEAHGAFLVDNEIADNGSNVDSQNGQALQQRFIEELFEKLEAVVPGVTAI